MSGICGILRFDDAPAEGLDAMLAVLERRGPDATRAWRDGSVALGHTLLATTPEALHESLPLTDEATGCTITADVRLDNREELLPLLGLAEAGRVVGDGELILRAYLEWGDGCLDRLLGDFAFVIWDPRSRRLLAARDQMGLRRLAYARLDGQLVLATEPRAVRACPGVPPDLDEGRIADFLENSRDGIENESTLYRAIRRLPAAHLLIAEAGAVTVRRYWSLVPEPPLELDTGEAYAEAFLEVFTEAVRCRLRNAGGLGAMLSGGMDSGSIVAVATRLLAAEGRGPLPTVSVTGPDLKNRAEAVAIRASLTLPGLEPHIADIGDPAAWLEDLDAVLREVEEPFDSGMTLQLLAYLQARRAGIRVLLDGLSGDLVLHEGHQLAHLVRSGRLLDLWGEAGARSRNWGALEGSRWRIVQGALRLALMPKWMRAARRAWRRRNWMKPGSPILSPDFARHVNRADRIDLWLKNNTIPVLPTPLDRAGFVTLPSLVSAREYHDRLASFHGMEPRDPFMDLRVIRFCLRCPHEQVSWNGWPKLVLRRAMKGLLPDEVIWRPGRTHFGLSLSRVLVESPGLDPPEGPDLTAEDEDFLRRATGMGYGHMIDKGLHKDVQWSYKILALWLRNQSRSRSNGPSKSERVEERL